MRLSPRTRFILLALLASSALLISCMLIVNTLLPLTGAASFNLDGLLADPDRQSNQVWLVLILAAASLWLLVAGLIAAGFYRLYSRLRREVEERQNLETRLERLDKSYHLLFENAPFPMLISRLEDETVLYLSPMAAHLLKIAPEYARGIAVRQFYAAPAERDAHIALLAYQGCLQDQEVQLRAANGDCFWAFLSATVITYEDQRAVFSALVDITRRKELEARLETLAMTDELTGLYNRRFFSQRGQEECLRAQRYHTPLSLLMLDLDRFKSINDSYGHEAGDIVLKQFAQTLKKNLRVVDIVGRVGGEEFAVLLPNTTREDARRTAEHLREIIAASAVSLPDREVQITTSIGVAARNGRGEGLEDLLRSADAALYQAKGSGRNQVICAEPVVKPEDDTEESTPLRL